MAGHVSGGKDAVYAGFDLEQAQRSAIRLGSSIKLSTENSEQPPIKNHNKVWVIPYFQ
jgi:hypothetical protein